MSNLENTLNLTEEEHVVLARAVSVRMQALASQPASIERDNEMRTLARICEKALPFVSKMARRQKAALQAGLN